MDEKKFAAYYIIFFNAYVLVTSKTASILQYPHHVSIEQCSKHMCSGAFVHESWIITVASCVSNTDASTIYVRARTSTLYDGSVLSVSRIIIHEEFDKYVYDNDIALLKLAVPAEFGEKLLPIGLRTGDVDTRATYFVTGWKKNAINSFERGLTVTEVPVIDRSTCINAMPSYKPVTGKMVCAGNMIHGVETCQGDPGAPLIKDNTLIGVLTYGLGCETMIHPGVYTRITSYIKWISLNTGINYV